MNLRKALETKSNDYGNLDDCIDSTPISTSVIIPVYNHGEVFEHMYKTLATQPEINAYPEHFQVIVIDDGSTDDVEAIVQNYAMECKVHVLKHDENRGAAIARNTGIIHATKARNPLLTFLDSDVILPENYFAEHWKLHNARKNIVAVGLAENIQPEEMSNYKDRPLHNPNIKKDFRFYKDLRRHGNSPEFGEFRIMDETDELRAYGFGRSIGFWTLPYMVVTHNLSVKLEDVQQVQGFDTRFRNWGCEDTHFGAKLIALGCHVIPVTKTGVYRIKHTPRLGSDELRIASMRENQQLYERLLDEQWNKN